MTLSGAGRVLIVDDDVDTRWLLTRACEIANYAVGEAASGQDALKKLEAEPFDVMLLDLSLPDMHGVDVLDTAATSYPDLITIVLTANPTQESAIAAIKSGVADYLRKPLKIKEVLEAIAGNLVQRALRQRRLIELGLIGNEIVGVDEGGSYVKRSEESGVGSARHPRLQLNPITHEVKFIGQDTERVILTKGETAVLAVLLGRAGDVLPYQDLAFQAWGDRLELDHAASIIRPLIYRLRQKLETDPSMPHLIQTVRGVGYTFNPR